MDVSALMWQEGWRPTTDFECSQLMKLLGEKRKETERIASSARAEIFALESIGRDAEDKLSFLENKIGKLLAYYVENEIDEDDRKETKTTIKYRLARGEIILSKSNYSILKPSDDKALQSAYPQFVRAEPTFCWGDFKKTLEVDEDGEVRNKKTGEKVDLEVTTKPQVIKIELAI